MSTLDLGASPKPMCHLCPLFRLPGKHEQNQVDHYGQGDAQEHADQQPQQAPSSLRLEVFRAAGHDLGAIFISKSTSSKTASR